MAFSLNKYSIKLLPIYGFFVFILLFIVATYLYPGGTKANAETKNYSWSENYICDLSHRQALNGKENPGQLIDIIAMGSLCLSIAVIVVLFAYKHGATKVMKLYLSTASICSMVCAMLLFTKLHNSVVHLVLILTIASIVLTLINLYKIKWKTLFYVGVLSCFLLLVNYIIFLSTVFINALPVIQKLTLACFLIWLSAINLKTYRSVSC
jgi:hypothetical protein